MVKKKHIYILESSQKTGIVYAHKNKLAGKHNKNVRELIKVLIIIVSYFLLPSRHLLFNHLNCMCMSSNGPMKEWQEKSQSFYFTSH